jgi:CubicO group peptidase (beta-lactamase class C family)
MLVYKPPVFADDNRLAQIKTTLPVIDSIFKHFADSTHCPAIAYGLVVDGKLVYSNATGDINIDEKIPATPQSLFRIASMTKSFTAMSILKLRDEGKLNLDDPAYKYIPEMKQLKYLTSDASPITIRNLLTHSAGFPEDNPWGDRQLQNTNEELINLVKKGISFSNVPGFAYEYSNLGFTLLGYIIQKVSGKPYEEYIDENILKPLGMLHTQWEYTKISASQLAHGYRWINKQWVEQPLLHDGAYGAMGGMITSIEDFSKYVELYLAAWPPSNVKDNGPVKRSSIREMCWPWNVNGLNSDYVFPGGRKAATVSAYCYGLGWMKDDISRVYVGHSGGLPGFGSNWRIMPDYGIGIISFANLTYAGTYNPNLEILDTIISLAHLQPRVLPPSNILQQRRDELIKILPTWSDTTSFKIFAVNFFKDCLIDSLKKQATTIFNKAGEIVKLNDVHALNQLRGSFIVECKHANIEISFTLTPENPPLIQEYHIHLIQNPINGFAGQ